MLTWFWHKNDESHLVAVKEFLQNSYSFYDRERWLKQIIKSQAKVNLINITWARVNQN